MPLDPARTVAELKELRELTGDENGAQRVAWTDTWETRARVAARRRWPAPARSRRSTRRGTSGSRSRATRSRRCCSAGTSTRCRTAAGSTAASTSWPAVEVLRRIAEEGRPPLTVRVVNWADEEGARFGRSLFGSSAACGSMADQDELRQKRDSNGIALPDALAEHGVDLDNALARAEADGERGRLPRAAHRAGPGARVDGSSARRRARHVRRRAPPDHVEGPGRARRLDADGQAPRRARRCGEARARDPADRGRGRRRRGVHVGRRRLQAGHRHVRRRDGGAAAGSAAPRRGEARAAARARAGGERAVRARGEHRGRRGTGSGTSGRSCSTTS